MQVLYVVNNDVVMKSHMSVFTQVVGQKIAFSTNTGKQRYELGMLVITDIIYWYKSTTNSIADSAEIPIIVVKLENMEVADHDHFLKKSLDVYAKSKTV